MDVFVVALLIERSFQMFASLLGTWIPFALIFLSSWAAGSLLAHSRNRQNDGSGPKTGRRASATALKS
jgi:hypothetical protein